jgi:Spy/CpxP family protein refolding chaperone
MQSRFRRGAVVAAAALAMVLGAGVAVAQPAGGGYGPGPGGHHGFGAGGPHGPGGGDAMIGGLIQKAKTQLNLNTGQQAMFDAAVASGKVARDAARERHQKVRAAMQTQLAASEPDLRALATLADDVQQQDRAARIAVRNDWLKLYDTFTPEQKVVVRDLLQARAARMEGFRQKMHGWMQQHMGAGNG